MRDAADVRSLRLLALRALAVGAILLPVHALSQQQKVPVTKPAPVIDRYGGIEVADPYRWLEDQDAPETRAWIDAQNAYTETVIGALPGKEQIERRLSELLKVDTVSVPFVRGGRYFFSRRAADQDLAILCVRKKAGAPDEILVDPHGLSKDHTVSVGFQDVSVDGRVLVYGVRAGGEDEVTIRLMDVDTRTTLSDSLPKARYYGVSISSDKKSLYYARQVDDGPRVFYHALGTDPSTDRELFGKGYGPEKIITANLADEARYLVITVYHGSASKKTEVYVQDVAENGPMTAIVNDIESNFFPTVAGGRIFLQTDWLAPNYRVVAVDLANPARERWREVVPENKSVITALAAVGGKLFISVLADVQSKISLFEPDGRFVRDVQLPGIGTVGGVSGEWTHGEAFFSFSSFAQPTEIYRHEVATGRQDVWARLNVPVSGDSIEVKQVWYASKDGTKVPMFVAHRKGLVLDGNNPTLLTGYGGFNLSQLPVFSQRATFWLERGGVYALPNLRGGGEFGESWHRAGMLEKKQNVFDDFIAAAAWLIANKYTSPARLAISGGSNGGLLVGAAMTQRPELFRAVVCTYPLLDMLRYHRFLVAGYWVPEYGSADNTAQFGFIYEYSPYHHVKPGVKYPSVLFITGDADTRVAPFHARKMTALMQASTGSDRPVLLRYETKAGHSGGLPIRKTIEELTEQMRFLFWQLDMKPAE